MTLAVWGEHLEPLPFDQPWCCQKTPYSSRGEANRNARDFLHTSPGSMRSYACTSCGAWHLTSQPKATQRLHRKRRGSA